MAVNLCVAMPWPSSKATTISSALWPTRMRCLRASDPLRTISVAAMCSPALQVLGEVALEREGHRQAGSPAILECAVGCELDVKDRGVRCERLLRHRGDIA